MWIKTLHKLEKQVRPILLLERIIFSFESSGLTQAENFIKTVPSVQGTLPPAVDVEFYEHSQRIRLMQLLLGWNLKSLSMPLRHYGKGDYLYNPDCLQPLHRKLFYDNPLWIKLILRPTLSDDREWTFWQYSDRGRLNGYEEVEGLLI